MQLFDDIKHSELCPARYSESSFSYLNSSARRQAENIRRLLESWFDHYPNQFRSELRTRFRLEDDAVHIAATFELAFHELLLRLGMSVDIHPKVNVVSGRPDFKGTTASGAGVIVEATSVTLSSRREQGKERLVRTIYDEINKLDSPDFFIAVDVQGSCVTPPAGRHIRSFLSGALKSIDHDALSEERKIYGRATTPTWIWRHQGLTVGFTPIPKRKSIRGKPGVRPLGMHSAGETIWVGGLLPSLVGVLKKKGNKYGSQGLPLVIAINRLNLYVTRNDCAEALFGSEEKVFPERSQVDQLEPFWTGASGPRYRRVSAVLFVEKLTPWTLGGARATLFHNPWAKHSVADQFRQFPRVRVTTSGDLTFDEGLPLQTILGFN